MKVYEFYLNPQYQEEAFDKLCESFYSLGPHFVQVAQKGRVYPTFTSKKDEKGASIPHPRAGQIITGPAVYSVSRNPKTHWVMLMVDDNSPPASLAAIEARIEALKDDDPVRSYEDEDHHSAPMETPRHFSLEHVLHIRAKQKAGTLGRVE